MRRWIVAILKVNATIISSDVIHKSILLRIPECKNTFDLIKLSTFRMLAAVERLYPTPVPCGVRRDLALESASYLHVVNKLQNPHTLCITGYPLLI